MKSIAICVISLVLAGAAVRAHGGFEHVRGVVTNLSAGAVTVQVPDKTTKTLTLTDKTTFKQGAKTLHLADLKLGDRVVIDVAEKTTTAVMIQIGPTKADAKGNDPHK